MVNMPGFDDAIARAGSEAPALRIGLHLNLIAGAPLSVAPSLTDPATQQFWPFATLLRRASLGQVATADITRETDAQFARLRATGVRITHVDSHRHTHIHGALWPAVVAAAARAGVDTVRIPREPLFTNATQWRAMITKLLLGASGIAHRTGVRTPDHFTGISLQGIADFRAGLLGALKALQPGTTELMVHPGYVDDVLRAQDAYQAPREAEVRALIDPAVRALIAARGIALVSFDGL